MTTTRLAIIVMALVCLGSAAEARGRRMMQQPAQYYYTPTVQTNVAVPTQTVAPQQPTTTATATSANAIVPASATAPANANTSTNSVVTANSTTTAPAPAVAAVGSAQWKAEQSARMCSVAHIGGGFGGGSFEGNGFGATAQQAIQNCCFWGQRTPIEIGVARGANGYYATVFYR